MDAVQRGMLLFDEEIGGAHIGGEHAFLDQPMRIVAGRRHDVFNLAAVSKQHHCFCRIEIDRTAFIAGAKQHLKHFIQMMQVLPQIFVDAMIGLVCIQKLRNIRVRKPGGRVKHRFHEFVTLDFAGRRNRHLAYQRQAINVRLQRTHFVRQCFGQHRNHAPRKVHRIAAQPRFPIQRVAGLHVMRYIGNRHQQAKPLALAFAIHSVVKVPRGFAVDGDKRQIAQVRASFHVGGSNLFRDLLCQRFNIIRPDVRQIVLP